MDAKALPELDRDIRRIEAGYRDHLNGHVSPDAFRGLAGAVAEIKEGQRWVVRLLVGQIVILLCTIVAGVAVALILRGAG